MRVGVLGVGYVGLVTGACFAELGNEVVCYDIDAEKIAMLSRGELPIFEPGLEEIVRRNRKERRLSFTTEVATAVHEAAVVVLAVGTPSTANGEADLSQIFSAAISIARSVTGPTILVIKSTVPVGTADKVRKLVASEAQYDLAVVSNPEFLKEGDAINDFMKPDRVVIGTTDLNARSIMKQLYEPFVHGLDRTMFMDNRSAELTKYVANSMLAMRVSFMNDVAMLCEKVGADVDAVRTGVGADPRIGRKFLFAGPGFGGSCFPKDLRALAATGRSVGHPLALVDAAIQVNEQQKAVMTKKIVTHFGEDLGGRRFTVWGVAFKPNTDDIREAPALALIQSLLQRGAAVTLRDPAATHEARKVFGDDLSYSESDYDSVLGADALILMTEWREFRTPDFAKIRRNMASAVLFDGRNIWDPAFVRSLGFTYYGIGRQ